MTTIAFGKISIQHVQMDIISEMDCISPVYELAMLEAEADLVKYYWPQILPHEAIRNLARDMVVEAGNIERASVLLFGSWEADGLDLIPTGELSFLLSTNTENVIVVNSRYYTWGNEVEDGLSIITDGTGLVRAYCLPPDLMDEDWLIVNRRKVLHVN